MCKTCAVHGCDAPVFHPNKKYAQEQKVCRKHYFAKLSGRVGPQWKRDIHNFHRKGHCEWCGVTAGQLGMRIAKVKGIVVSIREAVRTGMKSLEGDHIDGRDFPEAHYKENIQTLCPTCHRIKSLANEDHIPVKFR